MRLHKIKRAEKKEREGSAAERGKLLARLARRGVDYAKVKAIVQFDIPQLQLAFARQFERRKISEVLRQVQRWRALLQDDFLIQPDLKAQLMGGINAVELFAYQALLEGNLPQVGSWKLELRCLSAAEDENGEPTYLRPSLAITAIDQETKERRQAVITAEELNNPVQITSAYRKAFEELGLGDLVWQEPRGRRLVTARRPQGWPVFTQWVVPRLYEYLRRFYRKRAHYSDRLDGRSGEVRPSALYPRELLEDILAILRAEHPTFFALTSVGHVKADVQRYLSRKTVLTHRIQPHNVT